MRNFIRLTSFSFRSLEARTQYWPFIFFIRILWKNKLRFLFQEEVDFWSSCSPETHHPTFRGISTLLMHLHTNELVPPKINLPATWCHLSKCSMVNDHWTLHPNSSLSGRHFLQPNSFSNLHWKPDKGPRTSFPRTSWLWKQYFALQTVIADHFLMFPQSISGISWPIMSFSWLFTHFSSKITKQILDRGDYLYRIFVVFLIYTCIILAIFRSSLLLVIRFRREIRVLNFREFLPHFEFSVWQSIFWSCRRSPRSGKLPIPTSSLLFLLRCSSTAAAFTGLDLLLPVSIPSELSEHHWPGKLIA